MNKKYLLLILLYPFLPGHSQPAPLAASPVKNTSSCVLFGSDSMAYYYGSSSKMDELKQGNIYDHIFMSYVLKSVKNHSKDTGFKVVFKPTDGAGIDKNLFDLFQLLHENNIQDGTMDSLDNNEKIYFRTRTYPGVIASLTGVPLKLTLSKEERDPNKYEKNIKSVVSLIVYGGDNLYAYEGKDINAGAKYSFTTIDKYLLEEMKKFAREEYIVVIKPTDDSNYKEIVDILDKMKINKIEKYALVEVTDEETLFVKGLK